MHPLEPLFCSLGHRTYERDGHLWINVGRFSLTTSPGGLPFVMDRGEIDDLLRESGALVASFATALPTGIESVAYTIRDPNYGPKSVKRQFRQHLMRGSEHCEVRELDSNELFKQGLSVNRDTARQRNEPNAPYTESSNWAEFCDTVAQDQTLLAIGCFVKGKLAAFVIGWINDERCDGLMMHHDVAFTDYRPTHKIIHGFGRIMISRPGISLVCIGRDSIPSQSSLAQFKRSAGFDLTPIRVAVLPHPGWGAILTNPWTRGTFRQLRQRMSGRIKGLENSEVLDVAAMTQI